MAKHYVLTLMDYISGKVILPHYKNVFLGVSGSSISAVAYGILIGQRWDILLAGAKLLLWFDAPSCFPDSFSFYLITLFPLFFCCFCFLVVQNAIYAWNSSSFTNAMDVPALQRVLVPLSWFTYCMLQMMVALARIFVFWLRISLGI